MWLEGLFEEVKRVRGGVEGAKGLEGNHCKQTKGVPGI